MANFEELSNKINNYIRLSTFPVGVKLLDKIDDLDSIKFGNISSFNYFLIHFFSNC